MEIVAKRQRRGWWRALRALVVAAVLLAVALMIPPALGYQARVVSDGSASGAVARGSMLVHEPIPASGLDVGDTVIFRPPGAESDDELVTREIVAVGAGWFQTRGAGGGGELWQVSFGDVRADRAVFSLPLVGYPVLALGGLVLPPWTPAVVALVLAVLLVGLRRSARPPGEEAEAGRGEVVMAPVGAPVPPSPG